MTTEKQDKHLQALKEKHHALDVMIDEELARPAQMKCPFKNGKNKN